LELIAKIKKRWFNGVNVDLELYQRMKGNWKLLGIIYDEGLWFIKITTVV